MINIKLFCQASHMGWLFSFPSIMFSFSRLLKLSRMSFQKGFKVLATVFSPSFPSSKMLSPPHFSKESIHSIFQGEQFKGSMYFKLFCQALKMTRIKKYIDPLNCSPWKILWIDSLEKWGGDNILLRDLITVIFPINVKSRQHQALCILLILWSLSEKLRRVLSEEFRLNLIPCPFSQNVLV
jgi:hypothetical protein